jgi:MFS family permease
MPVAPLGRALAHRNFRLFLFGQGISLVGTWMQQVAMGWLLYRLTASAFLLGLIGFASQIPSLFLSPLGGVVADRWPLHRALLVTQSLAMLQAVLLLVVTRSEGTIVWPLIGLGLFLGVVNAFDMPLRQSFMVDMVPDREHLGNAIALNSSIVNGARLVGPSLAGLIIAAWGESACILLNAVSYVAVLAALLAMRDLPVRARLPAGSTLQHLKDGFAYAFGFAPLRALLVMLALVSFVSMSLGVLMPVFARDILQGDAGTQGFLMGAQGAGALCAALYLAARKSVLGLGRVLVFAASLFGAAQLAFSWSSRPWVSMVVLIPAGFCMMLHLAASNTLIQTIVEEDKRGRVMSLYSMAFLGIAPLGSIVAGSLAEHIGAPATVRISGTVCILAALLFARQLPRLRELVRPIYIRAGILSIDVPPGE